MLRTQHLKWAKMLRPQHLKYTKMLRPQHLYVKTTIFEIDYNVKNI